MEALQHLPFSKLALPHGEELVWYASNPTFHRTWDYGIVITGQALYLFSPFWLWLARWRRYPLSTIRRATFKNSYWLPRLVLETQAGKVTFRAPYDGYQDEMDFDRRNLAMAVELLEQHGVASNNSFKPKPLRGSA
ncbi:hypothetical protein [Lysobacter sp. A3-1-A15]|uniref:hypothetical protein n=1 Tax=Novilysobacter viscosus TaxID=3098602 RepID=UPI002EDA7E89